MVEYRTFEERSAQFVVDLDHLRVGVQSAHEVRRHRLRTHPSIDHRLSITFKSLAKALGVSSCTSRDACHDAPELVAEGDAVDVCDQCGQHVQVVVGALVEAAAAAADQLVLERLEHHRLHHRLHHEQRADEQLRALVGHVDDARGLDAAAFELELILPSPKHIHTTCTLENMSVVSQRVVLAELWKSLPEERSTTCGTSEVRDKQEAHALDVVEVAVRVDLVLLDDLVEHRLAVRPEHSALRLH